MASAVVRMFVVYALAELVATAALIWAIGFGWTVFVLLAGFAVGLVLTATQIRRQYRRLYGRIDRSLLTDSGLVAAGAVLVAVPGPVSTLVGLLLLAPPTRPAARPLLTAMTVAGLGRRAPLLSAVAAGRRWYAARRAPDYIDADYIDAEVVGDAGRSGPRALRVG